MHMFLTQPRKNTVAFFVQKGNSVQRSKFLPKYFFANKKQSEVYIEKRIFNGPTHIQTDKAEWHGGISS